MRAPRRRALLAGRRAAAENNAYGFDGRPLRHYLYTGPEASGPESAIPEDYSMATLLIFLVGVGVGCVFHEQIAEGYAKVKGAIIEQFGKK